jgi:hypothetical protein
MLETWSLRKAQDDGVATDLADSRGLLQILRLKLDTDSGIRFYGAGVIEVSAMVARSLGLTDASALTGRGLDAMTLDRAHRDLLMSLRRCREVIEHGSADLRDQADQLAFGCLILLHLYRLRFHTQAAPASQREEAEALADTFANLLRGLADAGA